MSHGVFRHPFRYAVDHLRRQATYTVLGKAQVVDLAGVSRGTSRLTATGIILGYRSMPVRVVSRMQPAALRMIYSGPTVVRGASRVRGATLKSLLSIIQPARLLTRAREATLTSIIATVQPVCALHRVRESALTLKLAAASSCAVSVARGTLQFTGTTVALMGISRDTSRLLSTSMALVYGARPSRSVGRVREAALTAATIVDLTGMVRAYGVATGRVSMLYGVTPIRLITRLSAGSLTSDLPLTGVVRGYSRVQAATLMTLSDTPLAGMVTAGGVLRETSLLSTLALNGRSCGGARVQSATLDTPALSPLRGTIRTQVRLSNGVLLSKLAVVGTARHTTRAIGWLLVADPIPTMSLEAEARMFVLHGEELVVVGAASDRDYIAESATRPIEVTASTRPYILTA